MRFIQFIVRNYKGINELDFRLEKSINSNIYTLVGLNESGKTTILEAINLFNTKDKTLGILEEVAGSVIKDYNTIIPINKRDNFNGSVSITAVLKIEQSDLKEINSYLFKNSPFKSIDENTTIVFTKNYNYKNSEFVNIKVATSEINGTLKTPKNVQNKGKVVSITYSGYSEYASKIYSFIYSIIPSIIYFPNFLFDFPSKIHLELLEEATPKDKFYQNLFQDILNSLENDLQINDHIVKRKKSIEKNDKRNLDMTLLKVGAKITDVVFSAWNKVFNRDIRDGKVKVEAFLDEQDRVYVELSIESGGGIYLINERSLGFRWFFSFLLFTQFRQITNKNKNILFLFDEPASNLHSNAQKHLLSSFKNLTLHGKVIYTTHSHHMINPKWLESTYVVMNSGINLNPSEINLDKQPSISIHPYKEFVVNHPHNTAYFQPVLDILDYVPSDLELIPKCAFFEGKNDYYTVRYFNDVIIKNGNNINMAPSTGSGNLSTLISLYMGWGKEFMVILDSDKEGLMQKDRYIEEFGLSIEENIFSLEDIDSSWSKIALEKLFKSEELLKFEQSAFPGSTKYSKKNFNRAMQESLINEKMYVFSEETTNNFKKIIRFIDNRFKVPFIKSDAF